MIRKQTSVVTLEIACDGQRPDGSPCPVELTVAAEDLYKAVNLARQEGWRFRYPHAACPTCQLPTMPSGRASIVR
jgi:hypothetical protein